MSDHKDILGNQLTSMEEEVLDVYERLKALSEQRDLPPCVERNAKQAMAHMWNAARDLNLVFETLLDTHGV